MYANYVPIAQSVNIDTIREMYVENCNNFPCNLNNRLNYIINNQSCVHIKLYNIIMFLSYKIYYLRIAYKLIAVF